MHQQNIGCTKPERSGQDTREEASGLGGPLNTVELLIPATRYFMGRCTIGAACHAKALAEQWKRLPMHVRAILRRDIAEELDRDDAARVRGDAVLPLGQDCDREFWERVRKAWLYEDEPYNPADDPKVPLERIHGCSV